MHGGPASTGSPMPGAPLLARPSAESVLPHKGGGELRAGFVRIASSLRETSANTGRAESTPGERPRRTPALKKARRGRRKWISRVGRPVASPRFSRPGLIGRGASSRLDHRSSGPSAGPPPCEAAFGVPLAPYGRARLVVAGGRMSSGFLVRLLTEPFGTALQSRRPPESDATARPPRGRPPSAPTTPRAA